MTTVNTLDGRAGVIEEHETNLHAVQQPRLPLPPHSLYCCAAAALHVRLGTRADSPPGEMASQGTLHGHGREHDGEHMAKAATSCVAAPMTLRIE